MLVVTEDLVGRPRVTDRERRATPRDLVQLVGEAPSASLSSHAHEAIASARVTASVFVPPVARDNGSREQSEARVSSMILFYIS